MRTSCHYFVSVVISVHLIFIFDSFFSQKSLEQMNGTKDGRTVTWMVFIVIFISFRNSTWLLVAIDSDRKVSSVHLSVHPCVINFHIFNLFFGANSCPVTRLSTMFLFLKRINIKIAGLAIDWRKHFQLLLQNYYR